MVDKLSKEKLMELFAADIDSWEKAKRVILDDRTIIKPASYAINPRTGLPIGFNPARSKRPAGYKRKGGGGCPIDRGDTTHAIVIRELVDSDAFSFVNENRFPLVHPEGVKNVSGEGELKGGHFLVWSSTEHLDVHQLSPQDNKIGFDTLGELEEMLLHTGTEFPRFQKDNDHYGHVQIIKNVGSAIGGSLPHGHYQIVYVNVLPLEIKIDDGFSKGGSFAQHVSKNGLVVRDYGTVELIVPYCIDRPYQAVIAPKDTTRKNLHELSDEEKLDFSKAITDVSYALYLLMPAMGREFAYNLIFHTGPVGTMYIRVLPFTQEYGGFEQAGISCCQNSPELSLKMYQEFLKRFPRTDDSQINIDKPGEGLLNQAIEVYTEVLEPFIQ